jgi:phage terminase small subunit
MSLDNGSAFVHCAARTMEIEQEPLPPGAVDAEERDKAPLTPMRKAFVREYLKDHNATSAAIRAGYSSKAAAQIGHVLLHTPPIAAAIDQAQMQLAEAVNITAERVLSEMNALATSNLDNYIITDDGQVTIAPGAPLNAMAAVQSIKKKTTVRMVVGKDGAEDQLFKTYEVEIRLWDKPAPLKLIGKHVALFPDKIEHTGKNGGPIETVTRVERVIVDPTNDSNPSSN